MLLQVRLALSFLWLFRIRFMKAQQMIQLFLCEWASGLWVWLWLLERPLPEHHCSRSLLTCARGSVEGPSRHCRPCPCSGLGVGRTDTDRLVCGQHLSSTWHSKPTAYLLANTIQAPRSTSPHLPCGLRAEETTLNVNRHVSRPRLCSMGPARGMCWGPSRYTSPWSAA